MNAALTALIAGAIGGTLWYFGKLPRLVSLLAVVVGVGLTGGIVGRWLQQAGDWIGAHLSEWTTKLVGAGLPGLAAIVLLLVFVIQMVPRWGAPTVWTPAVGFALSVTLPLLGGAVGTASNTSVAWLGDAAAQASTVLFGG